MQADAKVNEALNKILGDELIAINQTFLHARMYRNWGLEGLNKAIYQKSIEDMKHADKIIQRILFLEGLPNLQKLGALSIGETPLEMLKADYQLCLRSNDHLNKIIKLCEEHQDYISRHLLEEIQEDEQDHIDWLESQLDLIDKIGLENYLQSQMED